jgi:internalin A
MKWDFFSKIFNKETEDESTAVNELIYEYVRRRVKQLHMSGRHLTELWESIGQDSELEELDLESNLLTTLPESIGQLQRLLRLDVGKNQLITLPESIGSLTQLEVLELSSNQLRALPESIGQLQRLLRLDVDKNQLITLPESIGSLTQLQDLDLSSNELQTLPEFIGSLTKLRSLDLSANRLRTLPESIGSLTQLQDLDLSSNELQTLPEFIGSLTKLESLDLSANRLRTLPESIGSLTQVHTLDLSTNDLEALPESIGLMTELRVLDLSGNQLEMLPESMRKLRRLELLLLDGNEKLGLPPEFIGGYRSLVTTQRKLPYTAYWWRTSETAPVRILEYYFKVRTDQRPLNEAKLILVGRGAAGKTCTVNRMINNSFDPHENKTEGIRITEWPLDLDTSEKVRLNIWDFGGQEIMHATHQFFLTQRSLYLVVLNGREGGEDADAEYWLKLIESFGSDSPVIIVLNKIKEHPFDLDRRGLQRKYPAIRDFVETDCEDGTGREELIDAIRRETDRLKHLRDAFPASWFGIKDRLASMKENYLTFEQYRKICAELGETDLASQELLVSYLNSLGIVLNYKDDPRLMDMHVLNPHWVTKGIYAILNAPKLQKEKGEIHLADIPGILEAKDYPAPMHRFLMDLMKKFDLCFSFPDDDAHYLIPELLDKQEPENAARFNPDECLNFQYHYSVLPEGLLPRFIVRTHGLSEDLPRWRTGVVLEFEGNKGLVKADVQDKKVLISISGPKGSRRRLLAIIRAVFDEIHSDIKKLSPQEMVPLPGHPDEVIPYEDLLVMESNGIDKFPRVVAKKVLQLDVDELVNGVDLVGTRRQDKTMAEQKHPIRLFCSYSRADESFRSDLNNHLMILRRMGLINAWDDRVIEAGEDWKQGIDLNLERADIILLLISADFIASDYCYEIEMKRALERHEKEEACVIPIILRDANWKNAPFAKLQALPKDGKPVDLWPNRDSAWRNISEGIERVVEEMRKKRSR